MNSPIAIYYESTIIYWNAILICAALIAAFFCCFALYLSRHRFGIVIWAYGPVAAAASIYLSRIIHWYCHMEQYESFRAAVARLDQGGYSILGVVIGSWITALLFAGLKLVNSRYEILDAAAPGLAFLLAVIRFCDVFNGACLGKYQIQDGKNLFCYTTEIGGIPQTRLAVFNISFLWLLCVAALSFVLFLKKKPAYRIFLILFCVAEIPIDSLRCDGLHLFFYGGRLMSLNKVAGFIGLAQLAAGLILIGYMVKWKRKWFSVLHILLLLGFIAGLALTGVCEYLVQRYTAAYIRLYVFQTLGSLIMGGCCIANTFLGRPSEETKSTEN